MCFCFRRMPRSPQRQPHGTPREARGQRDVDLPRASRIPKITVQAPPSEPETPLTKHSEGVQESGLLLGTVPEYDSTRRLEEQLLEHSVAHAHAQTKPFWPTATWRALVTRESIRNELVKSGLDRARAEDFSIRIPQEARTLIFTIFTLLNKASEMDHVMTCDRGLRDDRLPLVLKTIRGRVSLEYRNNGGSAACCFHKRARERNERMNLGRRPHKPKRCHCTTMRIIIDDTTLAYTL